MNSSPYEPRQQPWVQPQPRLPAVNGSHKVPGPDSRSALEAGDWLPAMTWICDAHGRPILFNRRWLEFTGCTLEPALQQGWLAVLHPDDVMAHRAAQQAALETRAPFTAEYRLLRADGVYRWILDQGVPRFGGRGDFQGYAGVALDITEHKRAEDQLRWLSKAAEQSPASIVITDLDGRIEYVNPKFTEVTGYATDEVIGRNPRFLKSGETPPEAYRDLWETIQTREWRGEFHNRRKNGELYWEAASICPIRDEGGKPTHYIAVKEDITDRKRMEAELRRSEARLRMAVESAELCVYDVDLATGQTTVAGASTFLGPLASMAAWERALHPDDRARVLAALERRKEGGAFTQEYRMIGGDGSVRHFLDCGAPERDGHWIGALRDVTARKLAGETQARLAAIVECSSDAIISLDASGRIDSWNLAAEKLYGYRGLDILGCAAIVLSPPARRENAQANIAGVIHGTPLSLYETEHMRKDETVFPVSITASPIRDAEGQVVGGSVIIRDITAQRRAQQALLESESRFRALVQNSSDVITLIDPNGVILYDSPAVVDLLGVGCEQRVGQEMFPWIHPDDLSYIRMMHAELLRTGGAKLRAQLRLRHADGSWRWCDSWAVNLLDDPGVRALVTSYRDITELKIAETALRESEQRYRTLIEEAGDAIFTIDLDGSFTSVNRTAERLSGYSRHELLGMNMAQITSAEYLGRIRERINLRKLGGDGTPLESELITRDGRHVALEVTGRLQFKNGAPSGLFCIARDVSQRKRFERLQHHRGEVLELVAQNQSLDTVLGRLEEMLEQYYPGAVAQISLCANCGWTRAKRQRRIPADYRGLVETPIHSGGGKVLGRLRIARPDAWQPSEAEMVMLDSKAKLAAIAVEHRQLTNRLAYQAHHDPLTGLPNRLLLDDRLHQAMVLARRQDKSVALIYVDLDRFKFINDTLGHHVGDVLLKEAARRMERAIRDSDTVARTGGDEFVAVLFGISAQSDAEAVADRIVEAMREPFHVRGHHELFTSASAGLSIFPRDGEDAASLHKHADIALYEAKNRGRNRFQVFAREMNAASHERLEIESQLHRALDRGELILHFQPQFQLASGELAGVEALLRWRHPKWGIVPPARFVPVAEETGLIIPIGLWVLREACRQHQAWRSAGHPPVSMAVNISAIQFMRSNLAEQAAQVLTEHGMEPGFLELELTEGVLMRDTDDSARQIADLRALGVRIAIDDFGTGFSSLNYLQRLPIDDLKIDKCFVQGIDQSNGARSLVQAMVGLAHSLQATATAEGVETEGELEILRTLGCDRAQGFLLGRPIPADVWNY